MHAAAGAAFGKDFEISPGSRRGNLRHLAVGSFESSRVPIFQQFFNLLRASYPRRYETFSNAVLTPHSHRPTGAFAFQNAAKINNGIFLFSRRRVKLCTVLLQILCSQFFSVNCAIVCESRRISLNFMKKIDFCSFGVS